MKAETQISFRRSSRTTVYARPKSPPTVVTSPALTFEQAVYLGFPTHLGYFLDPMGNVFEFEVLSAPSFFDKGAAAGRPSRAQVRFLHSNTTTDGQNVSHLAFRTGCGQWVCDWFAGGDRTVYWLLS